MTDKDTKADAATQRQQSAEQPCDSAGLQNRYGTIGIEAVAAAVRCTNFGKKPAEQPKAPRIDQRFEQAV
jgi:hypothetical protein